MSNPPVVYPWGPYQSGNCWFYLTIPPRADILKTKKGGGTVDEPLYREIYDDLRKRIETGEYSENSILPAERVLCET